MEETRLQQQLAFILELEHLKNVYRQTYVLHEDRKENDAEHSFHLALMAAVLAGTTAVLIGIYIVMNVINKRR